MRKVKDAVLCFLSGFMTGCGIACAIAIIAFIVYEIKEWII